MLLAGRFRRKLSSRTTSRPQLVVLVVTAPIQCEERVVFLYGRVSSVTAADTGVLASVLVQELLLLTWCFTGGRFAGLRSGPLPATDVEG